MSEGISINYILHHSDGTKTKVHTNTRTITSVDKDIVLQYLQNEFPKHSIEILKIEQDKR